MKYATKLTQNGQVIVGVQDSAKRLQLARQDSIAHLKGPVYDSSFCAAYS